MLKTIITITLFFFFPTLINSQVNYFKSLRYINDTTGKIRARDKLLSSLDDYNNSIGKKMETFSGQDISGGVISNYNLTGKITLINFWFNSCSPCRSEFGKLNALVDKYKADSNFQVISITFDSITDAKRNAQKNNLKYKVISLPKELCTKLNLGKGYPTNLIVNNNGEIAFGSSGIDITGEDIFSEILIPKINSLLLNLKISNSSLTK